MFTRIIEPFFKINREINFSKKNTEINYIELSHADLIS